MSVGWSTCLLTKNRCIIIYVTWWR